MDSRVIRVSRKRQITIPLKFYEALSLGDQKEAVDRLREEADRIADGVQPDSRFDDIFDPED